MFNCFDSPWFKLLDQDKFERHVDRVQKLDIQALVSCHSPVIQRPLIDEAFKMIRRIPTLDVPPQPGQPDLDAMMHAIAKGEQYIWRPGPPPGA
jgi:hypothetical protein